MENFGKIDVELKPAETKVANQLIEALAAEWEPEKYSDTFQENLKKLIQAHLEGKEVTAIKKPKKMAPVVDLMAALKESLAQTEGKKKPPQRVESPKASEAKSSSKVSKRSKKAA